MAKQVKKNYNSLLIEILGEKPVAFSRTLAQAANCPTSGLFLSQLLYWWRKGTIKKGWVRKTIKEVHKETYLNRSQQDRAIKIWRKLGILEVERHGVPRRRFFRINTDVLIEVLASVSGKNLSLSKSREMFETNQCADSNTG